MSTTTSPQTDLLLEHMEALRAWCRSRCSDSHLADDVVQDTALTALRELARLRDPACIRPWLFRIAQRRLADALRRRDELPLIGEPPAAEPDLPTDRGAVMRVRRALRRLPLFLRRPVRLHYLQGRPLREVATSLDTTVNGVKARLYRARRIMRNEASQ